MAIPTKKEPQLSHHYAISADGTNLSYYSVGKGPNVLVMHGAVCYALSHRELAIALSPYYTVHIASRRERGLSGTYPSTVTEHDSCPESDEKISTGKKEYNAAYSQAFKAAVLNTEIADLAALVAATSAEYLITISSSAIIALEALIPSKLNTLAELFRLKAAIIFEPPLSFTDRDSATDLSLLSRFEAERKEGDDAGAMVTAMQLVQLGPGWIPRWLMKPLSGMMMRGQEKSVAREKEETGEDRGRCTMRELGQALRYDFAVAEGAIGDSGRFKELGQRKGGKAVKLLVLSGARTPRYLREATTILADVILGATSITIDGTGHELLCGADMRGQPEKAVSTIRAFFL